MVRCGAAVVRCGSAEHKTSQKKKGRGGQGERQGKRGGRGREQSEEARAGAKRGGEGGSKARREGSGSQEEEGVKGRETEPERRAREGGSGGRAGACGGAVARPPTGRGGCGGGGNGRRSRRRVARAAGPPVEPALSGAADTADAADTAEFCRLAVFMSNHMALVSYRVVMAMVCHGTHKLNLYCMTYLYDTIGHECHVICLQTLQRPHGLRVAPPLEPHLGSRHEALLGRGHLDVG